MTRTMYDSTSAADIPADAEMVAYYPDIPDSVPSVLKPGVTYVVIARSASQNYGSVLDVETSDATPDQAPGWVLMRRAHGTEPTVYMNESTWPAVRAAFTAQNVPEPHYWVAAYPGPGPVLYTDPDSVAHQYINEPGSGGHYDISVVADHWPGVDPEPLTTQGDGTMLALRPDGSGIADAFIVDNDNDALATFQILSDGTNTAPYVVNASPISRVLGAVWSTSTVLTVLVRGTDGNVYTIRYGGGTWSGYTHIDNGSGAPVLTP